MSEEFRDGFKTWEKALMAAAGIIAVLAALYFFGGNSIRSFFGGVTASGERVGDLSFKVSEVKRRLDVEAEFKSIQAPSPVYNLDTIVTAEDGSATLTLDDGSRLELGPNTMIRLEYETSFSLTGISRVANVNVVKGEVSGTANSPNSKVFIKTNDGTEVGLTATKQSIKAPTLSADEAKKLPVIPAKPTPTPTPTRPLPTPTLTVTPIAVKISPVSPADKQEFAVDPSTIKNSDPQLPVTFKWKVSPPDLKVHFVLKRLTGGTAGAPLKTQELLVDDYDPNDGVGRTNYTFKNAGAYYFELSDASGISHGTAIRTSFVIKREVPGIELETPLVGGKELSSNLYSGEKLEKFGITLRWKEYPGVDKYRIVASTHANSRPRIFEVDKNQFTLNKDKVFSGEVNYQVEGKLKRGFYVVSPMSKFSFAFQAPIPRAPADGGHLSQECIFTWHTTNFTSSYEFQISGDSTFQKGVATRRVPDNFIAVTGLRPGLYYWRVRSLTAEKVASPYSTTSRVIIDAPKKSAAPQPSALPTRSI